MSHGGTHILVQKDERYDKFFSALDGLRKRLSAIPPGDPMNIRETHNIYFQKEFKPFIPVTSIYNKIKPSGSSAGVIAHSGGHLIFELKSIGNFTSDISLHVKISSIKSPKDGVLLRYCAYPGIRLLENVQLKSDAIVVDEYGPDDVIAHSRFEVSADQQTTWDRNMGQQQVHKGSYFNVDHNEYFEYTNGIQTPQSTLPDVDLYIPLQFWFCKDPEQALFNGPERATQRTITFDIAQLKYIISAWTLDPDAPGGLVRAPLPIESVKCDFTLVINDLCVMPEVYEHISRQPYLLNLIRVHKKIVTPVKAQGDNILLDKFKFPTEYMIVRAKSRSLANDPDRWYLSGGIIETQMIRAACYSTVQNGNTLVAYNATDVNRVVPVLKSLAVRAKGHDVYHPASTEFYSGYLPSRYNSFTKNRPGADPNISIIPFCVKPGQYDPSGYLNFKVGHELNLDFTLLDNINHYDYDIITCISALNFLLTTGDSIKLKYAY
jgi:hypothetical protein